MLTYRYRHCGIGLCQNISPMPLAKKPYRFFANSHARVAQQQFRAAYSIIPVETDTATSFNYHQRKTDGKVLSPLSAYIFLYLILPIAHKEVRRVVPTVRMLAYRHRHRGIGLCQNISPMPRRIHPNLRNKICPARFPRCARAVLAPVLETVCVIVRVLKNCSKAISPVGSFVRSRAVTVSLISCILMRSYHACRIKIFIP